jgi:hypothetical protein
VAFVVKKFTNVVQGGAGVDKTVTAGCLGVIDVLPPIKEVVAHLKKFDYYDYVRIVGVDMYCSGFEVFRNESMKGEVSAPPSGKYNQGIVVNRVQESFPKIVFHVNTSVNKQSLDLEDMDQKTMYNPFVRQ